LILDEIQYAPELISAIKRKVDETDEKSQYLLTGSQNLGVLKTIQESMAGRVLILDLYPMSYSEISGNGSAGCWLDSYLNDPASLISIKKRQSLENNLLRTIWRGGLPGLLDLDDRLIHEYLKSYIETYILRDILSQENIQDREKFSTFLGLCAAMTAQEINHAQFGRDIGISPKTADRWLGFLERTYQFKELQPYHGNTIKRLSGKAKGHLNDTGLACYLQRISSPEALLVNPLLGSIFETWVYGELNKQSEVLNTKPNIYHWRTSAGAEVDFILEIDGRFFPIETKSSTSLSKSDTSGIRAFNETYKGKINIMTGLVIYAGSECYWLNEDVMALPWNTLLIN
jgi:predicted AAA+ superfamily ATPase